VNVIKSNITDSEHIASTETFIVAIRYNMLLQCKQINYNNITNKCFWSKIIMASVGFIKFKETINWNEKQWIKPDAR